MHRQIARHDGRARTSGSAAPSRERACRARVAAAGAASAPRPPHREGLCIPVLGGRVVARRRWRRFEAEQTNRHRPIALRAAPVATPAAARAWPGDSVAPSAPGHRPRLKGDPRDSSVRIPRAVHIGRWGLLSTDGGRRGCGGGRRCRARPNGKALLTQIWQQGLVLSWRRKVWRHDGRLGRPHRGRAELFEVARHRGIGLEQLVGRGYGACRRGRRRCRRRDGVLARWRVLSTRERAQGGDSGGG